MRHKSVLTKVVQPCALAPTFPHPTDAETAVAAPRPITTTPRSRSQT